MCVCVDVDVIVQRRRFKQQQTFSYRSIMVLADFIGSQLINMNHDIYVRCANLI